MNYQQDFHLFLMNNLQATTRYCTDKATQLLTFADEEVEKWKKEALQQYPTPEAYQAVCDVLEANKKENQDLKLALSEACDDIDTLYSMTEWVEHDYLEGRSKIYRELLTNNQR